MMDMMDNYGKKRPGNALVLMVALAFVVVILDTCNWGGLVI